jgi:hypothetical protein
MVDWPGLLQWSTKYHDGTKPSEFKQMSDEDKAFLMGAMEEAFGKVEDPNKVMAEAIQQIKSPERSDESITVALEVMDRSCDDPDCARNIEKLDGLQPLLDLLSSHTGAICVRTCEILALLFSNNANIQQAGGRRGAMDVLLQLVRGSSAGSEVRSKAFRALAALVRQMKDFEELFLGEKGGIGVIIACADAADIRLCEKVASFVRSLAQDGRLKEADIGCLVSALTPLLRDVGNGQIQYRETLSSCMTELTRCAPRACPPMVKEAVQERLAQLKGGSSTEMDDGAEQTNWEACLSLLP